MNRSNLNPLEKSILSILLCLICIPIITIPFVLMIFYPPKWNFRKIGEKKNLIIGIFGGLIIALMIIILALGSYYIPSLESSYYDSNLFPQAVWTKIKENDLHLYMIFIMDGLQCLLLFIISHILLSKRNSQFEAIENQQRNGWDRLSDTFKWKSIHNGYPSGEKTLYKLKMASLLGFIAITLVGGITPFILWDFDMPFIIDRISTNQFGLTTEEYIAVGAWAGIGGFFYIITHLMLWVYLGRLLSNFATSSLKLGINNIDQPIFLRMIQVLGWLCSLGFLIPFIGTFFTHDFSYGYWVFGGITTVGLICYTGISFFIIQDPKNRKIDPYAQPFDLELPGSLVRIQRFGLSLLITGTIFISIINGWLWFGALRIYLPTVMWYDSGFYLLFGLLITIGPVILLFHLDSIYARRFLLVYHFILVFLLILNYLALSFIFGLRVGRTKYYDIIPTAEYPIQIYSVYNY